MSTTLVTFPGRAGDLLWALPSVRAISEALAAPVDVQIAGEFASLGPLLEAQPYIADVWADETWGLHPPDEWRAPAITHRAHDRIYHIGYRGWPQVPLALQTYIQAQRECEGLVLPALELGRPWLRPTDYRKHRIDLTVGFTEEYFELKVGVLDLLRRSLGELLIYPVLIPDGRWEQEHDEIGVCWEEAATRIAASRVFVGCCSAPHVLAVGLGIPAIVMEPSVARQNDVFYPCGKVGPQVTLVTGNDGQPTWDARAVAQAIRAALESAR